MAYFNILEFNMVVGSSIVSSFLFNALGWFFLAQSLVFSKVDGLDGNQLTFFGIVLAACSIWLVESMQFTIMFWQDNDWELNPTVIGGIVFSQLLVAMVIGSVGLVFSFFMAFVLLVFYAIVVFSAVTMVKWYISGYTLPLWWQRAVLGLFVLFILPFGILPLVFDTQGILGFGAFSISFFGIIALLAAVAVADLSGGEAQERSVFAESGFPLYRVGCWCGEGRGEDGSERDRPRANHQTHQLQQYDPDTDELETHILGPICAIAACVLAYMWGIAAVVMISPIYIGLMFTSGSKLLLFLLVINWMYLPQQQLGESLALLAEIPAGSINEDDAGSSGGGGPSLNLGPGGKKKKKKKSAEKKKNYLDDILVTCFKEAKLRELGQSRAVVFSETDGNGSEAAPPPGAAAAARQEAEHNAPKAPLLPPYEYLEEVANSKHTKLMDAINFLTSSSSCCPGGEAATQEVSPSEEGTVTDANVNVEWKFTKRADGGPFRNASVVGRLFGTQGTKGKPMKQHPRFKKYIRLLEDGANLQTVKDLALAHGEEPSYLDLSTEDQAKEVEDISEEEWIRFVIKQVDELDELIDRKYEADTRFSVHFSILLQGSIKSLIEKQESQTREFLEWCKADTSAALVADSGLLPRLGPILLVASTVGLLRRTLLWCIHRTKLCLPPPPLAPPSLTDFTPPHT